MDADGHAAVGRHGHGRADRERHRGRRHRPRAEFLGRTGHLLDGHLCRRPGTGAGGVRLDVQEPGRGRSLPPPRDAELRRRDRRVPALVGLGRGRRGAVQLGRPRRGHQGQAGVRTTRRLRRRDERGDRRPQDTRRRVHALWPGGLRGRRRVAAADAVDRARARRLARRVHVRPRRRPRARVPSRRHERRRQAADRDGAAPRPARSRQPRRRPAAARAGLAVAAQREGTRRGGAGADQDATGRSRPPCPRSTTTRPASPARSRAR